MAILWGLSVLDFGWHAIDELGHHPSGVFKAECDPAVRRAVAGRAHRPPTQDRDAGPALSGALRLRPNRRPATGGGRRADLQRWVSVLVHTDGLAPSTIRGVVAVVSSVFAQAVADGLIARNPCSGLALPELSQGEVLIPTDEQLSAIVGALSAPWYRRMVLVAAGSGLRAGELRGLTEDRVDWLRGRIKVDRQLAERELTWSPPKSKAGYRTVSVAQVVIEVMAQQIAERGPGPDGLIFTNRFGGFIKQSALNRALARALDPLGWPTGTGLHLSGTTTRASSTGVATSKWVQKLLGHNKAEITLNTYLNPRELHQMREKPQVTRSTWHRSGVSGQCVTAA